MNDETAAKIENKAQLIQSIRDWVAVDSEIKQLKAQLAPRIKELKRISKDLHDLCRSSGINTFDLKDGKLCYKKQKVKTPITKKVLMQALSQYFQGDEEKANQLHQLIHSQRPETIKECMVMKAAKKSV